MGNDLYIFDLDKGAVVITDSALNIKQTLFSHDDLIGNNKVYSLAVNPDGIACLAESKYLYVWRDSQLQRYRNVHNIKEFILTSDRLYCLNNDNLLGHSEKLINEFDLDLHFIAAHIDKEKSAISQSKVKGRVLIVPWKRGFSFFNILSDKIGFFNTVDNSLSWNQYSNKAFAARLEANEAALKLAEDMEKAPRVRFKSLFMLAEQAGGKTLYLAANEGRFTIAKINEIGTPKAWISDQYTRGLISSFGMLEEEGKEFFCALYINSGKGVIRKYE